MCIIGTEGKKKGEQEVVLSHVAVHMSNPDCSLGFTYMDKFSCQLNYHSYGWQ